MANILVQLAETASKALGLTKIGVRIPFLSTDTKSLVIKDSSSNSYNFPSSEYMGLPLNNFSAEIGLNNPNLSSSNVYDALTELASRSSIGAMTYQTTWNASTNTPTLPTASALNKGFLWRVSVAGSTNISGITDWDVDDFVVSNGVSYDKWDHTDDLSSAIAKDGTTTTTAVIPFAEGLSVPNGYRVASNEYSDASSNPFIMRNPVSGQTFLYDANGRAIINSTSTGLFNQFEFNYSGGTLMSYLKLSASNIELAMAASFGLFLSSTESSLGAPSTANRFKATDLGLILDGISSGTPISGGFLGLDASGYIVKTSLPSSGIATSGFTQITAPWSIGNGTTEALSTIGMEMRGTQLLLGNIGAYNPDPADSNVQIVDQGLTILGTSASFVKKIPLSITGTAYEFSNFKGYDNATNYVSYSAVSTRFDTNTSGSHAGSMVLQYAQAGALVNGLILNDSGAVFNKGGSFSGALTVVGQTTSAGYKVGAGTNTNFVLDGGGVSAINLYPTLAGSNTFTGGNNVFQGAGSITQIQTTNTATLQANFVLKRGDGSGTNWLLCTVGDASNGVTDFVVRHNTFGNVLTLGNTGNATLAGGLTLPTGTATMAPLNIGASGVTKTTPVTGDIWRNSSTGLRFYNGTANLDFAFSSTNNTFSGTQTFNGISATGSVTSRQLATTRQTSATSTGAIAWALSSGGQMDLTTALTGAITMNITAPINGGWSCLFVTHGATLQNVTLSLTGVTWIVTGANGLTGTNTIVLPSASFTASKSFCIQLYWSTTTRCFVTIV